ncbi:unnamed protein product [Adineta ricciae]|nr:unnamed protein product [Adineta ricciae]
MVDLGSEIFDIGGKHPLVEVQHIIENAIIMLDTNHKDTVPESIFLMGGVQNAEYEKLNDALTDWRLSPSIIGPSCEIISSQRLRTFIEKIKYHNLCINFIENSISVGDIIDSTWISDVSIVCDKTLTPPLTAICQYFGKDSQMDKDRVSSPTVIYIFNFSRDEPHAFICPTRDPSPFVLNIIHKINVKVDEKSPSTNLFVNLIDHVIHDLIPQIRDQ